MPWERGAGAPLTPSSQLQQAESGALMLLCGRAAERLFWPLCGRYAVAVHEGAHAVCGYVAGAHASRVSIVAPDSVTAGYMLGSGVENYAGAIRVPGRTFVASDLRGALVLLYMGEPGARWQQYRARMKAAKRGAAEFVRRYHWPIAVLAERLLKAGELGGSEIRETIEGAMSDPRAALPAAQLPEVARLEDQVVMLLAGAAAARRSLRGSVPVRKRMSTADEVRAHHEAAHAVALWFQGLYVWELSILVEGGVRVGKTAVSGGRCVAGDTPKPSSPIERPERMETDLRRAARICLVLALAEPRNGWRPALRIAHRLRSRARDLVEQHWFLIERLAVELAKRRELSGAEVEKLLGPRGM
jgi:hypothetical protein